MAQKTVRCLVTAGPTQEYFDPVRFISNPSSGKMGWHIAKAAKEIGWETTLILGPSALSDPDGVKTVRVVSAQDMLEESEKAFEKCDILIMAAAVCDVRPKARVDHKVKKGEIPLTVELERTPDILLTLSKKKKGQILIGFAAETRNLVEYAKEKLEQKNLDAIVANIVGGKSSGFGSDSNEIVLIMRSGEIIDFNPAEKKTLASHLIKFVSTKFGLEK